MKRLILPACIICWISALASMSDADVVTDISELSADNTIVDFELLFAGLTANPLTIGNVTFSSTTPLAIEDITSFDANGTAVTGNILRANGDNILGSPQYSDIRIDFDSAVNEIGFGWFDPNFSGNELQVFNASGMLLEAAAIPIGPEGGSFAAFRGIVRDNNDIAFAIARVSSSLDVYGLDNISFGTTVNVPEPGFGGLAAFAVTLIFVRRNKSC